MTIRIGSLCSGVGLLDLGIEAAIGPAQRAWHAEVDPDASTVLAHHHPDVPNLGDITAINWAAVPPVDVMTMGFPCTDISCAGRMLGLAPGTRSGIWSHCADAIAAIRPRLVFVENVEALLSTPANRSTDADADGDVEPGLGGLGNPANGSDLRALGAVLGDLASVGFDAEWCRVSASSVGAPHRRNRIFIVAWPGGAFPACLVRAGTGGAVRPGGHGVSLLPTPAARLGDWRGQPNAVTAERRMHVEGRRNLEDAVALLPTPAARDADRGLGWGEQPGRPKGVDLNEAVALLPTPRATDGTKGGPNQRGSSGDLMLPSAVMLLPTPTVADSRGTRNATAGRTAPLATTNHNGWTLGDVAHADRWGEYAPAISRWEQVVGWSAPDPTEPGAKGQPRLSARFVEWMMGAPSGWVTDHVGRNAALKALGNGVVPQQAAYAYRLLLDRVAVEFGA